LIFAAGGHNPAVSNVIEVGKASSTTTITPTPTPSVQGQSVTVSWSVASSLGVPTTGTVTVTASGGTESCSQAVTAGSCSLVLNVEGSRLLTATYSGNDLLIESSGTKTHTVQHLNRAPVAVADAYTTLEDADLTPATGVLSNDTDADNDPLSAEVVTDPQHGTVALNANGTFTYHPNADYHGSDAFTYRASDGALPSSTVTVTITVDPVNDAPSFSVLGDQSVMTDAAGEQQVGSFAQVISLGANEQSQQVAGYDVVVEEGADLFTQAPAISPNGDLTYVLSGTPGTAKVNVQLRDDGGTDHGGQNTSGVVSFAIVVTAPN
jgi:VCBS repeat-containing protein